MNMIILNQSYNQFMRRKEDLLYLDRIKCRWVEESERPTKYFLNLEKKNYNKKKLLLNFTEKMEQQLTMRNRY